MILLLLACEPLDPTPPVAMPGDFELHGIDVSHHQGRIDWPRVADSGEVDFVFVKATEGVSHVDRRFHANWPGARDAGLAVGAYHYFSLCRTGDDQADHFIAHVPVVDDALPPVVDIEEDGRCNRGSRLERVDAEVGTFVDRLSAHYGVEPLVYSSLGFHRRALNDTFADSPRWVAAYRRTPPSGVDWLFWQYTDRTRIPGIRGPVDGDVFSGTAEELRALGRR